jgi:hypothetical protein
MRTSFHHQPEAQHPNFQLSTSWQADYPIFSAAMGDKWTYLGDRETDAFDPSLPFDDQFCGDAQQRFHVAVW